MLNNIGLPGLLLIAVVLILPFFVGMSARKRGRSFWLWTLLSFFMSAIIGWLLLLAVDEKLTSRNTSK